MQHGVLEQEQILDFNLHAELRKELLETSLCLITRVFAQVPHWM